MISIPSNPVVRELPVIRVFVSSTFSDLVAERNALAENVWPKLEHYCRQRGFTFQAIDLRWGVPSEAGLDHRTMQICMEELRRAQETSPEPNFLILLGNKYGWRPLPEVISEAEYAHLCEYSHSQSEQDILSDWYRRDTNAKPTQYVLRARTDSPDGQDYTRIPDADGRLRDTPAWQTVQDVLWTIVNRAYPHSQLTERFDQGVNDVPAVVRFQASATEQEIWHGALRVEDAREHVVAVFREIDRTQGNPATSELHRFVDLRSDQSADDDAVTALTQLKAAVKQKLLPESLVPAECRWEVGPGGDFTGAVTTDHLVPMCDAILTRLRTMILRQINDYWGVDLSAEDATAASVRGSQKELELEQREHSRFARERGPVALFVGRDEQVRTIREYLQSTTNRPLIVHGPSGSGKTALMAYVAQQPFASDTHSAVSTIILTRFIGVHPESSAIRGLMTSLCRELRLHFPVTTIETDSKGYETIVPAPLPDTVHKLTEEFYSQLKHATADRPIFVFLDALDQLAGTDHARDVNWLRSSIIREADDTPNYARIIASCLSPSTEFPLESEACEPFRILQNRGLLADDELGALDELVAQQLVRHWLAKQQRGLTEEQWKLIDAAIHNSSECRQPLYLKVLHELVRGWRAFDSPTALPTSLANLLQQTLSRLSEPSRHDSLPRIALGYLVSASYGLSEGELLEVLYRDTEVQTQLDAARKSFGHELPPGAQRFPIAPWTRLRSDLRAYLSERPAPGTTVLYFYHRQVEQAVRTMFMADEAVSTDRLRRLANYFDGRWDQPDAHALVELPDLLLAIPDYEQLNDRLTNFAFPMRKAEVGLLESIPDDYGRLGVEGPTAIRPRLRVWQEFLRERLHILRRGLDEKSADKILLQLSLEHADDSPLTQAAEIWLAEDRCDWIRLQLANLPAHATRDACRAVLDGHTCGVLGAQPLAGDRILSWSQDKTLRVWDATTGACRGVLAGHRGFIEGALSRPDDSILSWSLSDSSLRVWETATSSCHAVLEGHSGTVRGALLLDDGRIVSWSIDKTLRVWDAATGTCLAVLEGHSDGVGGALLLDDGRIVSWGGVFSRDSTLRVWDAETGTCHAVLEGHTRWVAGAIVLLDGRVLSWGFANTMRVWDAKNGTCDAVFDGHTNQIDNVLLLPDGRILSWSRDDKTLGILDAGNGTTHAVLEGHTGNVQGALVLNDDRIVSWGGGFLRDESLRVWDTATGTCHAVLEGHTATVDGAVSLKDDRIVSWSSDKTLRVWDAATGTCDAVLEGHTGTVWGALPLPDGRILSWSHDESLRVWDAAAGASHPVLEKHTGEVGRALTLPGGLILSWDGEHSSPDKALRVWDAETGACRAILEGHGDKVVGALSLSADRILSWARDATLRVWDVVTGDCCAVLKGHTGQIIGALLLPANRILSWAHGSWAGDSWVMDNDLLVWDAVTGDQCAVLRENTDGVRGALLVPDDHVLSWSTDNSMRVWDSVTGVCHAVLEGHANRVEGAVLIPGKRILSWALDKTLRVWDTATGACCAVLEGHSEWIIGAQWLAAGQILSWSGDRTVRVWDAATGACRAVLEGHTAPVRGALLLPDGRILSWSDDKTQRIWNATTGGCLEVVAERDVARTHPEWVHVKAAAERPASIAGGFRGAAIDSTASLCYRSRTAPLVSWEADSDSRSHCLLPDGTIVVGQANGQLCVLKLYHGRQRITLAEAEDLLDVTAGLFETRRNLPDQ